PVRDADLQGGRPRARARRGPSGPPAVVPPRRGDEGSRVGKAVRRDDGGGILMASTQQPEMRQTELELTGDELLVAQDVKKYFPVTRRIVFQKEGPSGTAVRRIS